MYWYMVFSQCCALELKVSVMDILAANSANRQEGSSLLILALSLKTFIESKLYILPLNHYHKNPEHSTKFVPHRRIIL